MPRRRQASRPKHDGPLRVVTYRRALTSPGAELEPLQDQLGVALEERSWVHVADFTDEHTAKRNVPWPGFDEAVALVVAGEADVLMATRYEHVARSLSHFAFLVDQALKEGWSIRLLEPDFDTTTAPGRAAARNLAMFAGVEREILSERTIDALRSRQAQGIRIGRPPTIPTKIRRRIVRESAAGKSLQKIADKLNADMIPTAAGGQRWYKSSVQDVLRQERAGEMDRARGSV